MLTNELMKMHGIILKDSIKHFGFKFGFPFWFRWSIGDPVKMFVWTYITKHPLCPEHGFFLKCDESCKSKILTKRKDKIKYQRERRKQIDIDSKTIIFGPNGECAYCNVEPGTEIIDDPNWDTLKKWKVCKTCKEILEVERTLSFLMTLPYRTTENDEKIFNLNNRLLEIRKNTGKEIWMATLERTEDGYKARET